MSPNPDGQRFEAAYGELQRVVAQLETSNVDLEQVMALLERGRELVAQCEQIVAQAEQRVTRLAAEPASPLSNDVGPEQVSSTPDA